MLNLKYFWEIYRVFIFWCSNQWFVCFVVLYFFLQHIYHSFLVWDGVNYHHHCMWSHGCISLSLNERIQCLLSFSFSIPLSFHFHSSLVDGSFLMQIIARAIDTQPSSTTKIHVVFHFSRFQRGKNQLESIISDLPTLKFLVFIFLPPIANWISLRQ